MEGLRVHRLTVNDSMRSSFDRAERQTANEVLLEEDEDQQRRDAGVNRHRRLRAIRDAVLPAQ